MRSACLTLAPNSQGSTRGAGPGQRKERRRRQTLSLREGALHHQRVRSQGQSVLPPTKPEPKDPPQAKIPSLPGAWSGGMHGLGGRGGKVFVVTNLNDGGPGSFRAAGQSGGPRIVRFNVAGIIRLGRATFASARPKSPPRATPRPAGGVCIAGDFGGRMGDSGELIVGHLPFRRVETWVGQRDDSFGGNPAGNS
jgi:hypothetical protein